MAKTLKSAEMPTGGLKISVRNFGPIARAENIALRPLTVFAGPSNTGKSYLAVLLYSLFSKSYHVFRREIISGTHKSEDLSPPSRAAEDAIDHDLNRALQEEEFPFSQLSRTTRDWVKRTHVRGFPFILARMQISTNLAYSSVSWV